MSNKVFFKKYSSLVAGIKLYKVQDKEDEADNSKDKKPSKEIE